MSLSHWEYLISAILVTYFYQKSHRHFRGFRIEGYLNV